ncbi:MAG: FAD-dependent oxidoreductase [Deltaproteobacteria bacterium]|uniref:FAD-dependent oxidoreductase n=1 Tax=Candidatus Zymogenus saltonus TaxID=2844893 RepID=A0A9D8PNQ1_9DELT|nr:FAD-dependent oxidoreductase [Candidatus Zymogenus saltonus]
MPYYIGDVAKSRVIDKYVVRPPEVFKKDHDIDIHTNHEVLHIDRNKKEILIRDLDKDEELTKPYDKLIITTGSRSRKLGVENEDAPNVFSLKSLLDGKRIKDYINDKGPKRVVTIGAGFISLEMAEAFGELGIENTIVHRRDLPMRQLGKDIAEMVLDELSEKGTKFVTDAKISSLDVSNGNVRSVVTDKGRFDADMVLVSVGFLPNVSLAVDAGLKIGETGAIWVDERQRTSDENIYAAGDCVEVKHLITGKGVNIALGDLANKQGWVAGENAAGGDIVYPGVLGSAHFKLFDLEVGFTGLTLSAAQKEGIDAVCETIEGRSRPGLYPGSAPIRVHLVAERKSRRLIGAQIAGRDGAGHRINILAAALFGNLSIDDIVDLDLAYAPPFTPTIDPILVAARSLLKKMG